ncbi:permease-like cell division protein FtsX [Amycolatopsis minnesotensis]|uniref:Cell division protein FtsX n=1 Tax=Amycolatopsis minnesotensis TaxID=337894 RepID=A0ABP5DRZ8_9PSEU
MRASFVFSEVITGLRRNITMTIAMIITTAISLAMLGGGLIIVGSIDKMQQRYMADIEVSVYFTSDISASDKDCSGPVCQQIRQELGDNPLVESVVFEDRDKAYQRFKEIFASQPELVELATPGSLPASLKVKLKDPTRSELLVKQYTGKPGVDRVDDQSEFLDRFFSVLNAGRNITFVVFVVLLLAALMLISNTIQVSAFTRRTEVGIMRLVGATRWYTQLPFLLEAVVAGLAGAVLSVGGLIGLKYVFLDGILEKIPPLPKVELIDILFPVAPVLIGASVIISAITGYLTLRLYVRN